VDARSASPLVANVACQSDTNTRSKSVSLLLFQVDNSNKIPHSLAETAALHRRPKVVLWHSTRFRSPTLHVTKGLNTQTPSNEFVPLRHQFSRRLNHQSAWSFSFTRLGSVSMTSILSIGVVLTIWKDVSDVSYQECHYRQCSRHRRRKRVGTRRPHHIGIDATPVEMRRALVC